MPLFLILTFYYLDNVFQWLVAVVILTYLGILFLIDLEHRLILHPTSIVGAFLFLFVGIFRNGILKTLIGGLTGFVIMFLLYLFGILFNRWMSKRKGETIDEAALGYGDVNLSGVLGLLLGWPGIGLCLFFAIIGGGVFSGLWLLFMLVRKKYEAFTPIPYAPFLIISAIFILYLSINN
jgi:leader peptidase (prepilin peptidase)/N-methyltransferase